MVAKGNKPSKLSDAALERPQAQSNITYDESRVSAVLPDAGSIEVLLHGATVTSWKDASGDEKLWLSEAAALDGSAPVRGGIPIVFPVFGKPADHEATAKLASHGFARNSRWDFLNKSTSEGTSSSVQLDFGLSSENLSEETRAAWPYKFALLYSVTLDRDSLSTTLAIKNEGDVPFDFQTLFHTYFRVQDIESTEIEGLDNSSYIDQLTKNEESQSANVTFTAETDRKYTPAGGPKSPVTISEAGVPRIRIVRDNLDQVVVWNPWINKSAGMKDFEPKEGWKNMVCVEPGTVNEWQKLEGGDTFEASQIISLV